MSETRAGRFAVADAAGCTSPIVSLDFRYFIPRHDSALDSLGGISRFGGGIARVSIISSRMEVSAATPGPCR